MSKPLFKVSRQWLPAFYAQKRWDQAYQYLLAWSELSGQTKLSQPDQTDCDDKEDEHEVSSVCPGFHFPPNPGSDH